MHDTPAAESPLPPIADDLLDGADQVAAYIWGRGAHPRRLYRAMQTSRMPVFRLGGRLCARRSSLHAWVRELERQG